MAGHNQVKVLDFDNLKYWSLIYNFFGEYFYVKNLRDWSIPFGGIDDQRNLQSNWTTQSTTKSTSLKFPFLEDFLHAKNLIICLIPSRDIWWKNPAIQLDETAF